MRIAFVISLLTLAITPFAQQLPVYSLLGENKFLLNPAFAGSESYWDMSLQHRSQWMAYDNHPSTQILSTNSRIGTSNSAIGGSIYNDRTGVFGNFGVNAGYAHHINVGSESNLSFGLNASYTQYRLIGSKMILNDQNDALLSGRQVKGVFNSSFGGLFYSDYFFIGYSALNLIPNQLNYKGTSAKTPLKAHHYIQTGGYIPMGTNGMLEPLVVLNYINTNPFSFDFRCTYQYVDIFRVGAGYRLNDAVIFTLGFKVLDEFYINYAYDLGVSKLAKVHNGSHEIQLTYKFYYNPLMGKDKKRYNLQRIRRKGD